MIKKITVSAGILVHTAESGLRRICLARRSGNRNHSGYWEFPGGKVEPMESCKIALHREIWEELQIEITAPKWIHSAFCNSIDSIIEVHFFRAFTAFVPIISTSHDLVHWFTVEEMQTFFADQIHQKVLPADRSMLEMLINSLFDVTS